MAPYRAEKADEFNQWLATLSENPKQYKEHPIYENMARFYEENKETYFKIRLEKLKFFQPAPKTLPGYEPIALSYLDTHYEGQKLSLEEENTLFQDITNIRTLHTEVLFSNVGTFTYFMMSYINKTTGKDFIKLSKSYFFGYLLFVNPIDENRYKTTYLTRDFALIYHWDIVTNQIEITEALVYTGERQPKGWLNNQFPKGTTAKENLFYKTKAFRWSIYDNQLESATKDEAYDQMEDFVIKNHKEYTTLRRDALGKLPKPDAKKWEKYRQIDRKLTESLLKEIGTNNDNQLNRSEEDTICLPIEMSFYDLGTLNLVYSFQWIVEKENPKTDYLHTISWIVGEDNYATNIEGDIWKIQSLYGDFALEFQWNITTDELMDLVVKRK